MQNLKSIPRIKKSICPNCGEDLISNLQGDNICPSCDDESQGTDFNIPESKSSIAQRNDKRFYALVVEDCKNSKDAKFPILRQPEVLPNWLHMLRKVLDDQNEKIFHYSEQLRSINDKELSDSIKGNIGATKFFREKVRLSLREALRLSGETDDLDDFQRQLNEADHRYKVAKQEIAKLTSEVVSLKSKGAAKKVDSIEKRLETQVTHAKLMQKQAGFLRFGLSQLKFLLESGVTDKDILLNVVNSRLDNKEMEKYVNGEGS